MDPEETAAHLLDQFDVLRHATDLDLLVFFARHPRSLLSSEQIAAFLGYAVREVAASLELLLEAGLLTRTPHRRQVARMYLLTATPPVNGWLSTLTALARTRAGRLALISQIRQRSTHALGGSAERGESAHGAMFAPLRFPQERSADTSSQREQGVQEGKALDGSQQRGGSGER
jgi:hypothetical protein